MQIRDFRDGKQFSTADWTEEIVQIPNSWGTINNMGIFTNEPVTSQTVQFEEIFEDGQLIIDRVRGDRANVNNGRTRKIHTFAIPHFPLDDYISPRDLVGQRAYGTPNEAEKLAAVRTAKMERLRRNHAWTLEAARAQLLTLGTVYAPGGTVTQNWFTEFGKTQTQVDFVLGTSTTDVVAKVEAVIAAIQDNAGAYGSTMTGVVFLCSPGWFAKLIGHAKVVNAYQYYTTSGAQEPLRRRLAPGGSATALHRVFEFAGATFIEMRDAYNGTPLIPAGKAVAVPTGTDAFKTYFAPAERFSLVGTDGEELYMFEKADEDGTKITIQTESNFANGAMHPELIIDVISSN